MYRPLKDEREPSNELLFVLTVCLWLRAICSVASHATTGVMTASPGSQSRHLERIIENGQSSMNGGLQTAVPSSLALTVEISQRRGVQKHAVDKIDPFFTNGHVS